MEKGNHSEATEFILSGLTDRPELQVPLFVVFLLIYGITLVGNGGMILLIMIDPRLHTPMYFFLSNLFFCDLCYSSTICPKMLLNFLVERKSISYTACAVQMNLSDSFTDVECLLLAVMAYDRYVAICNPLHYTVTMSRQLCQQLVAGVYAGGLVDSMINTFFTFRLSFCSSNIINHFFCDIPPLLALSCSDTHINEIMEKGNHSEVTEFILSGLTDRPELQVPLFVLFLLIYGITLLGNGGMILLITIDPRLQTPMYFFLSNLSFCDLCFSSILSPKMLLNFLAEKKSISFSACAVQMNLCIIFADVECLLLAVMAYDRYVAICNPLLYTVTMSRRLCKELVVGAYAVGLVDSVIETCFTFRLSYCSSNIINHFFCDIPPLLALSCSDTRINEIMMYVFMSCIIVSSLVTVLLSYVYIISTILQISSAEGRRKTISTCSFHLTAVVLLFGTLLFIFLRPPSSYSMDTDKMASLFYTLVIPVLNPLIYSLRNTEVKDAVRRAMNKLLTNS
ncbi:olfactory receptor-like protein OLF1 [Mauremys reevesii]|uniref:olfactory receptor-like protein OLF1 n=2 Tax=Mauremys reevesii TaxID=260615 RepID=UPI00193F7545|nr:olfactory receptor-like protein OLF1 [Mauremys reevesii]